MTKLGLINVAIFDIKRSLFCKKYGSMAIIHLIALKKGDKWVTIFVSTKSDTGYQQQEANEEIWIGPEEIRVIE
jgi:hypothetical protein